MSMFVLAIGLAGAMLSARSLVDEIDKNTEGVALKGFDPVAYFTESKPVKGSQQFEYEWMVRSGGSPMRQIVIGLQAHRKSMPRSFGAIAPGPLATITGIGYQARLRQS